MNEEDPGERWRFDHYWLDTDPDFTRWLEYLDSQKDDLNGEISGLNWEKIWTANGVKDDARS